MISMDYSGKNYIVTGGAGGIGGAVVEGLLSGGGRVVMVDIQEGAFRHFQEQYGPDRVELCKMNLGNPAEIREKFSALVGKYGQIHGLICAAGVISTAKFEDLTQQEWDRVMAINLTGVFASVQSLFTPMKERRYGRIVVVSSVAAQVGGGLLGTCAYAVSKGGLNSLIKAVAKEGGPHNVYCCGVIPAYTKTAITASLTGQQRDKVLSQIPLGRAAEPREIANLILFYASDLASFITGEITNIDGGLRMD